MLQRIPLYDDVVSNRRSSTRGLQAQRYSDADAASAPASGSMPAEYVKLFQRYRKGIGVAALTGLCLGALISLLTPPMYRTRASLDIQGLNGEFLNMREVSRTAGDSTASTEVMQQTQIKLLQSDTVLQQTVQTLLKQPHQAYISQKGFLARLSSDLHLPFLRTMSYEDVLRDTASNVKVKPLGMTRLVELSCESRDPELATQFCNELVSVYEGQDTQNRIDEARKTGVWLARQLAEVKQQAEDSQRKLKDAVGGNGLVLSQADASTGEARLRELQQELVKAQSERMQKEADTRVARTSAVDTLPEVLDNPAYRQYQTRLEDLQNQVAQLVPPLTEDNPKVIHLRSQIREAELGLAASRSVSTGRERNELASLQHRESLLQQAYRDQE